MYKIDEIKMLRLGQRDENLARDIPMDASEWLELYPGASITILFRRPGESTITPMITTLIGTTLTWQINDFEVGITGVGNAEIRAVDVNGLRRKSRIIPCSIEDTLLGDDETVLYTQDQVDETLANIGQAAESALAAKASEEAAALSAENASGSADTAQAAQDAAESARNAAQAAQTAAEEAEAGAETAQSSAIASAQAAENARIAAQTAQASAQGSASQAAADKAAAQTAQQAAETAQHAAETAAGNAQASAGAASGSASAAAQSASDAAAFAASIGEAEQHAAASAQAAAQSASQAATKATQASQSASQASASADQAASSATSAAGSATAAAGSATAAQAVLDSIPEDYTELSEDVSDLKSAFETQQEYIEALAIEDTASGAVASFPDGADGIPLKSCVVGIEPVQEGTGDPSPDNVRPISGWTGVTVQTCGKNLFDASAVSTLNRYINKSTGNSGVPTAEAEWRCTDYIRVAPGIKLYFGQVNVSASAAGMAFYDSSKAFISGISTTELANSVNVVTVPDGAAFLRHSFRIDEGYNTDWEHTVYICLDSAPHEWTPYTGTSLPISWESEAGTVYGGTLDVTSGLLTVDREIQTLDGVNIKFTGKYNYADRSPLYFNGGNRYLFSNVNGVFSNVFTKSSLSASYAPLYSFPCNTGSSSTCCAIFPAGTEVADGNAWLQQMVQNGTPVQVIKLLATPQTYHLSPHEILSLLGQNHVWADTGDTSVIYRADPKMYIQRLTGETEDDMVANANIPSGKYFTIGNALYLSTSAIAAGETITPGTNCTLTDLATALNALMAQ